MSLKKRILRISLILLFLVLFVGYFAFSTFLFSPLEGGLGRDVATLIPRNVDFFLAKAKLGDAFSDFPRLAAMDELEGMKAFQTWQQSPEYAEFMTENGVNEALAEIDAIQSQLPLGMKLIDLFGSEDVAIAGYFKGRQFKDADWAAYGHMNFAGKLAVSAIPLAGLEKQGITVEKMGDEITKLSGGQLQKPLFLTRIKDVLVASTMSELCDSALDLYARKGQDSLYQSATYFDRVHNVERSLDKDEIEVIVDMRNMFENLQTSGAWPNPKADTFTEAFLGKFFQLNSAKQVSGVIGVDEGLTVDLHGEFSSELITPVQQRLYRMKGIDREKILTEAARLAPADCALFVFLQGNVGDLLRQVFDSIEKDMRDLIEEAFQNTGQYAKLDDLILDLDQSLRNRLILVARANDYPPDPDGPPHDSTPVPAVALISWLEKDGNERIVELRNLIGGKPDQFGLKGRVNPAGVRESGYYKNRESGFETREYWSEFVAGTGVIATVNTQEHFVIANSFQMLKHILKTYYTTERPRLADYGPFAAMLKSSLPEANMVVWVNPQTASTILRASARRWAEDNVPPIDWASVRAGFENEVIQESFPGQRRGALSQDVQRQVDDLVQPKLDSYQDRHRSEYVPRLLASKERQIQYFEASRAMLMMLALDKSYFDLSIRVVTPLE